MKKNNKSTREEQSHQSVMTHEEKVKNAISSGQEFIIVSDNDNKAYESGFADYLLRKYSCSNMSTGFRANLKNPVDRVPGGEFADPDNTTEKRPEQVGHTPGEKKLVPFSKRTHADIYLEYVNEWLTVSKMAENYGKDEKKLEEIINSGRIEHEENVKKQKQGHTPGEWQVADYLDKETGARSLAVWSGNDKTICLISPKSSETEQDYSNASLIVSAVNNTAGKGINPEAVPNLLEALKQSSKKLNELITVFGDPGKAINEILIQNSLAINKAMNEE